jgi:hypothetical protein
MLKLRIAIAVALAGVAALAVAAFVSAKTYAPLAVTAYYGPGFGFSKEPRADDSSGLLDLVMRGTGDRVGEIRVVLVNTGRWPVTIKGLPKDDHECSWLGKGEPGLCYGPIELRQAPAKTEGGYALSTSPFRSIRLAAHTSGELWVRFRETCHPDRRRGIGHSYATLQGIRLVYGYLGVFERTQAVGWPFGVTYVC